MSETNNTIFELRRPDEKEVAIAAVGDLHWGSHTCNEKSVRAWAKKIEQEQWYWVGVGDYTENALRGSVGDIHKQTMAPDEQVETLAKIFAPVAHKCLGCVGGNHGARSVKAAGFDVDATFAKELSFQGGKGAFAQPEILFCREGLSGLIQVGEARWKVMVSHCAGGGRTMGGKAMALHRMGDTWPMMDLYIGGHTHAAIGFPDERYDLSVHAGGVRQMKHIRQFSGCGSTLEYLGSYAQTALYQPASLCQVVHYLGDRIHRSHQGVEFHEKRFNRDVVML